MNNAAYGLRAELFCCYEFCHEHRPVSWVSASTQVLMLTASGSGLLYWKNDPGNPLPVDARTNYLHYLPSGSWRFVDINSRRPAYIFALHFGFKCDDGADFCEYYSLDPTLFAARKATFRHLIRMIAKHYRSHEFSEALECERYFRILQGYFCEALKLNEAKAVRPKIMRCRAAIDYLKSNYNRPIDINELASLCRISKPHFFALFRQETGMTTKQFVCRLRVERARKLLLFSAKTIAEVGLEVGWTDPFHFSRVFTRETGISPLKFRNQLSCVENNDSGNRGSGGTS